MSREDEILASARRACARACELLSVSNDGAAEMFRTAASEYRRIDRHTVADLLLAQARACEPTS